MLSLTDGVGWLAEALEPPQAFVEGLRAVGPSCLVFDISVPGLSGLEHQKRIVVARSDSPIIFRT